MPVDYKNSRIYVGPATRLQFEFSGERGCDAKVNLLQIELDQETRQAETSRREFGKVLKRIVDGMPPQHRRELLRDTFDELDSTQAT